MHFPLKRMALPVLVLSLALPLTAATWKPIGPYGGAAEALAADPVNPKVLYVGTAGGGGLFKSVDAGVTWSPSHEGLPWDADVISLAIPPQRPATVYAGVSYKGIYKSRDAGATWTPSLGATDLVSTIVLDPWRATTVLAGGNLGVYRTTDGGATWDLKQIGLLGSGIYALAADTRAAGVFFAGGGKGLFRSRDGGQTWSRVATGNVLSLAASAPTGMVYAGLADGAVLRSTDHGARWTVFRLPVKSPVRRIVPSPIQPRTVYAGANGVYRSTDGGRTWSLASEGLGTALILDLVAARNGVVYAGTPGGGMLESVYRRTDGRSWQGSSRGITALGVTTLAFQDSGVLWAGVPFKGLFRREDSGAWVRTRISRPAESILDVAVRPAAPGRPEQVWALADPGSPAVFTTVDAGATWQRQLSPDTPQTRLEIDPRTAMPFAFGNTGLYRWAESCPLGPSHCVSGWVAALGGIEGYRVLDLTIDPDSANVLHAVGGTPPTGGPISNSGAAAFKSTNSGSVWDPSRTGLEGYPPLSRVAATSEAIFATDGTRLFRSTDGGASWSKIFEIAPPHFMTDLDAGPDGTLYRTDFTGGVFASADGLSWNPVGEGLEGVDVVALWIDPEDPGVLYAGTGNYGLWVLEP
ncbi:MAG: hypothetical protein ACJ75H_07295 [Thermoanaerobaculia bacterium]